MGTGDERGATPEQASAVGGGGGDGGGEASAPSGRTLAEKIDGLFRMVHPRGRGEFSYEEVAEAMAAGRTDDLRDLPLATP